MSKTLKLEHGDLVVGSSRAFATVQGKDKLFQDLRLWILERIGTDPATPTYGSTLDGGVIDGEIVPSFIGLPATQERINDIKTEIATLLSRYQQDQLEKMRREVIEYGGKHTLSRDEVLWRVDAIEAAQVGTTVLVRVTCTTLANETFRLTVPAQV
jgi:hypothetical protein